MSHCIWLSLDFMKVNKDDDDDDDCDDMPSISHYYTSWFFYSHNWNFRPSNGEKIKYGKLKVEVNR